MASPERLSPGPDPWSNDRGPSPGRNFQMSGPPGTKLAQEIHDEFLTCKICLEAYKNPKSLNCLHTFCEQCIDNHVMSESTYKKYTDYREFTCPLCRKRTQLPLGGVKKLPDNFLVSSLTEVITRQKPSKFPFCDICKMVNRKHREAASKCLDCAKLLCVGCVVLHKETKVTKNHSIFDVEIEKDIECKEHQDEVVRFYCEPCETCICVLCTFNEHKDHDITQFGEAVVKYKDSIEKMLDHCKKKIDKFDSHIEKVGNCEVIIKGVQQQIHDAAIQFIQEIRNREKVLLEELENMYGKSIMEMIENKKDLTTQLDNLRSTCSLTEVILKGKDIELLLLKKDVQEKLTTLNSIDVKDPPATVTKVINYIPGSIDMGYIHDLDRPLLTRRLPRMGSKSEVESMLPPMESKEIQTDEKGRVRNKSLHETTTDDEDSEDESDDESDFEPELIDEGTQTEQLESESSESESEDESPETTETGTMTDVIQTEEKGINTRSRSLQGSANNSRQASPPADDNDNSLAARRRRRRERAQTTQIGSLDEDDSNLSYTERRKRRSALYQNSSMDKEDVFYDTTPSYSLGHRV